MAGTSPRRIRASLDIFGAPGMGGTATIEFRRTESGWRVIAGGSSLDRPAELGSLPSIATWRDRVGFVVTNAEPAYDDYDPVDVSITGARGIEADLLALAWSGPAGADAVRQLLDLSDSELAQLAAAASIQTQECIDALKQLNDALYHESECLEHIRSVLATPDFSWAAVLEHAAIDDERAAPSDVLVPTRQADTASSEVDLILAAWARTAGRVGSSVEMIGRAAQKAALRSYVERHLRQYRELPTGIHRLRASVFNSPLEFNVDFDKLRRE
jgi:hypothetical protein